jgi:predicted permease
MILFLRILFTIFFAAITASVIWASLDTAIWAVPPEVTGDAWFRTTLVDIYVSFFTFYVWVAYREPSLAPRLLWLLAIVCLGSMAVTAYCLLRLCRVPTDAPLSAVLLREEHLREVAHVD